MRDGIRSNLVGGVLLLLCMTLVAWMRLVPLNSTRVDAEHTYAGEDGNEHVYRGDLDSYLWLRHARTLLRTAERATRSSTAGRVAVQVGGELAGTVAYMSPEQVRADFVDARSDLYALDCMLYEAVVSEPPFRGRPFNVLDHHLNATPHRPSEVLPHLRPALDELIMRLLAKDHATGGYTEDVGRLLNQVNGVPDAPFGPGARAAHGPGSLSPRPNQARPRP